jgi:hypothetical protein
MDGHDVPILQSWRMDCLGIDHVVPQHRRDPIMETVFSLLSVPRLYTEIPRITDKF